LQQHRFAATSLCCNIALQHIALQQHRFATASLFNFIVFSPSKKTMKRK